MEPFLHWNRLLLFWSPAFNSGIMPDFMISRCLHLLRWIFNFSPWIHLCDELHLFICVCWNVPGFLEWSQVYYSESFFWCVFELCLQVFFWEFVHLCLSKRIGIYFSFITCFYVVLLLASWHEYGNTAFWLCEIVWGALEVALL